MSTSTADYLPREKPFIYFHSDASPLMDGCDCGDREWCIESVHDRSHLLPGASAASLDEALVYARLLARRAELGWDITHPIGIGETKSICWCGWSKVCAGWHGNDILRHVIDAHPEHPAVRG
jgi:hypothetical protein